VSLNGGNQIISLARNVGYVLNNPSREKYLYSFQCTPPYLSLSITKKNNSRLQYRNSGFNLDKAVGQSYGYIHTGTYNNDKLKHHDANIHNT